MGLLDVLLGRSKPVRPDLDQLFGLTSAAITLEAASDLRPTGLGSVCFAAVEGGAFTEIQQDLHALISVESSQDSYGYTWLLSRHDPSGTTDLVTDLHAVNSALEEHGFGPQLLCSLVGFRNPAWPVAGPRLPLQTRFLLPFRPAARREAGQRAGAPGEGARRQRSAAGGGPVALVPGLGRTRPVTVARRARDASGAPPPRLWWKSLPTHFPQEASA